MNKKLLTALFFCTGTLYAAAQTPKLDSLTNLINRAQTDTGKINLLVKKIELLGRINLDSAISLGEKTLTESEKINYFRGQINIREKLSSDYCFKGDYKTARENLNALEQLIKSSKDSSDFADVYSNEGMFYGIQSKYDSSIIFYEKAIAINEHTGNKSSLAGNYSNIAISYQQQSNFAQALFYQQKALKVEEDINDEINMAYTYTNMGITYDNMGDSVRAEKTYLKAIELAQKKYLTNVELYSYSNLSTLYITGKQWEKAYKYATQSATLGASMGDQGAQSSGLAKAAVALANLGRFDTAIAYAKKAIVFADSSAQPLNIYQAYSCMGTVLKLNGNCSEAVKYYEKSLVSLQASDIYTSSNGEMYKELSDCYEKIGNSAKALGAYKMYAQIADSVRSKDNIQKATEIIMNAEFDKKQLALAAEQKQKDAVADVRQLALVIGLGLTLALAIVAIIGFRNKLRSNSLLQKQKEEIQDTLTKLKATQSQLIHTEKMASLGELTAGIAHEIQNPLNFVNNFSEVSNELIDEMNDELNKGDVQEAKTIAEDIKRNLDKINYHGKRADAIVKGMLQHSRLSTGQKEETYLNALCNEYLRITYRGLKIKDKTFDTKFETNFDQSIEKVNVVPQDIGRVIVNLLNNAFYAVGQKKKMTHENYEPLVTLSTKKIQDKIEIKISDNGNGISDKVAEKIFQPFFTTKPPGEGTGLGLSLSYDIIKAHNGEIKVESKEGEGTSFIIVLPA